MASKAIRLPPASTMCPASVSKAEGESSEGMVRRGREAGGVSGPSPASASAELMVFSRLALERSASGEACANTLAQHDMRVPLIGADWIAFCQTSCTAGIL